MKEISSNEHPENTFRHFLVAISSLVVIYIPLVIIKGSLVRKLLSHGRLSWLAFPPSCQPHNHVNHHYQVVSWEAFVFSGNVAAGVAEVK